MRRLYRIGRSLSRFKKRTRPKVSAGCGPPRNPGPFHGFSWISSRSYTRVARFHAAKRLHYYRGEDVAMTVASDEAGPAAMLLASIGFRVQPHKRDEALSAVDETVRRMRTAPGCARTRLLADTEDPNTFTVLSEWQTAASADSFFASREFQIFKGIRILLRDEPIIVIDDVRSRVTRLLRAPTA